MIARPTTPPPFAPRTHDPLADLEGPTDAELSRLAEDPDDDDLEDWNGEELEIDSDEERRVIRSIIRDGMTPGRSGRW